MNRLLSLLVTASLALLVVTPLRASRVQVPLDTAIDRADIIAIGRSRILSDEQRKGKGPQLVQLTVDKCWKGDLKPGDPVVCVEWHPNSTASFRFDPAGPNLVFLKAIDPKDPRAPNLPQAAQNRYDIIDLKMVHDAPRLAAFARTERERELYARSIAHEKQVLDATQRLLDVRFLDKPADPAALWRKLLAEDANPVLLLYVAEHLPEPLSADDGALLVRTILRVPKERYTVSQIYHLLIKAKYSLDGPTLRLAIESAGPLSWMSSIVNAANIQAVQEPLFRRLTTRDDPDYADTGGLSSLARLAPDFVKQKLRAGQFPFEIELPLLGALGINGSAVGRPDYPQPMLTANRALVHQIGQMLRDQPDAPFNLEFTMEYLLRPGGFRQDWQTLAPLMSPLLSSPDAMRRRQTAAFLRTLGYTVRQDGQAFKLDQQAGSGPLPLSATIVAPAQALKIGQPWTAQYHITAAADRVAISAKPPKITWRVLLIGIENSSDTQTSTDSGSWTQSSRQSGDFTELKKGAATHGEYQLAASLFKSPGRYRITLALLYRDAGEEANIDAWTGVVSSEPVEVDLAR